MRGFHEKPFAAARKRSRWATRAEKRSRGRIGQGFVPAPAMGVVSYDMSERWNYGRLAFQADCCAFESRRPLLPFLLSARDSQ